MKKSDPVPGVYAMTSAETKGTYHVDYRGKDKDGNEHTKTYKLKANDNHHAQSKAMKIARSEFPHHVWRTAGTTKFFKEETPVGPVPGMKWKDYAVMVHKDSGQRVVIHRKNVGNYPEHEGWKEVAPGQKVRKEELEKFSDWIQEASCGSKTDMIKKAVKKMREEVEAETEDEVEQLEEATLAYHVKKASDAKERGDDKKFAYHMENARTARYAMTGKEMLRNRHHLDKYNELRNGK